VSSGLEGLAHPSPAPVLVCGMGRVGFRIVELLGRLGERAVVEGDALHILERGAVGFE